MSDNRIPVAGPSITQKEIDYVTDAARRCWGSEANYYHERFEAAFAAYTKASFAIAVTHCTSAIHLSLAALGVGPGDEVIVPDCTWIASAAPISYVGAVPVFADVDSETWCLSADSFARAVTPRTKAVIPVDLYGGMPDLARICEIAEQHGIAVVEDAAEAFGSMRDDRMAGTFGRTGVFSFHGSKTMTTGEGGMLVTDDPAIRDRVLFLRDHGRVPRDVSFFNHEVAFKYRMSSMQAALGLAQVERAEELVQGKRTIFDAYSRYLGDDPRIQLNAEPAGVRNSYWMITAVLADDSRCDRDTLMSKLNDRGIDTRPFFHPLSAIPAYAESPDSSRARKENTVSYGISRRGLNLPSGLSLTDENVGRVCAEIRDILDESAAVRNAA